jgi:hypothetical protein
MLQSICLGDFILGFTQLHLHLDELVPVQSLASSGIQGRCTGVLELACFCAQPP